MTTDPEPDRPAEPGRPDPADPRTPGPAAAGTPEPGTARPLDGDAESGDATRPGIDADETRTATRPGIDADETRTATEPADTISTDEPGDEPTAAGPFGGTGWPPPGGAYPPPPGSGFPPPGAGYPPPFSAANTPPGTGGWATRFGLSRPRNRYIAGVCGAFARATNTDPVLWRVGLAVLTLLGGLGGVIYVLGWLLLPADGDSGSPVEALTGRAWSSTSRGLTIVLLIIGAAGLITTLTRGFLGQGALAVVIVGGAVLLLTGRVPRLTRTPTPTGGTQWDLTFTDMHAAAGSTATPDTTTGTPTAGVTDTPGWSPAAAPTAGAPTYRAPYAPHGPYATEPGYDFPGLAPTTMPMPVPPPAPPAPPRPRRRRSSPARKITLSCTMLVVGVLAVLDVSNVISVPASVYFAAALATVGLGLIVGAFANNGRGPVTIGALLLIGLLLSNWITGVHGAWATGQVSYRPGSVAAISPSYSERVGRITLDLRDVNFADTTAAKTVDLHVNVGEIVVLLPADVNVHVDARVSVGAIHVLGESRSGVNAGRLLLDDPGKPVTDATQLDLSLLVNLGEVKVTR